MDTERLKIERYENTYQKKADKAMKTLRQNITKDENGHIMPKTALHCRMQQVQIYSHLIDIPNVSDNPQIYKTIER